MLCQRDGCSCSSGKRTACAAAGARARVRVAGRGVRFSRVEFDRQSDNEAGALASPIRWMRFTPQVTTMAGGLSTPEETYGCPTRDPPRHRRQRPSAVRRVLESMRSAFVDETACTCESEDAAEKSVDPRCPLHGRRYELNPKLATNSWLQPYVRPQSRAAGADAAAQSPGSPST